MKTSINQNAKINLKNVRKYNIKGLTSKMGKYKMFIVKQEEKEHQRRVRKL